MKVIGSIVVLLLLGAGPAQGQATNSPVASERQVTTATAGPIFPEPRDTGPGTQLAVFGAKVSLTVLDVKGTWYHVQFTDRSGKQHVGYTPDSFLDVPHPKSSATPDKNMALTANGRTKFDAVYRAAKAVNAAQFADIPVLQFRNLLLTLETETSIARDKAVGSAEVTLASMYHTAKLQFELGLRDPESRQEHWDEATKTLTKADKVYLGK